MQTNRIALPLGAPRRLALSSRALGAYAMLVSPVMLAETVRYDFLPGHTDRIGGLLEAMYMLGALATLVGLRRLRASGDGRFAAGLFAVQCALAGIAAAFSASYVVAPMQPEGGPLWTAIDLAWPATHVSMLVLGLAMIATPRRLAGWRRFPALAVGLALPAFIACMATNVGRTAGSVSFGVLTTLGFGALGYVVRTSDVARRTP